MTLAKCSVVVLSLLLGSCAAGSSGTLFGSRASRHPSEVAPKSGFVREVDEPSTRGQLTRVTPPDLDIFARFVLTPDGRSILFSARPAGTTDPYHLYRLEIGSTTPVKITSGSTGDAWYPSYTQDGAAVTYYMDGSFWRIRNDGSGAKVKIPGSGVGTDYFPALSSDSIIAFSSFGTSAGSELTSEETGASQRKFLIWTCKLAGGELTQYREGNVPVWSPDGSRIAFEYEDDIWMMDANGTELTQLTATKDVGEYKPCFSPDGKFVAFTSNEDSRGRAGKDFNIWYIAVDGSEKTQVTELRSWDSWPLWGPDGIYFLSGRAKGKIPVQRIWRMKLQ